MKKEDTEMMLRIFETERAGYAYLYPSDGGAEQDYISTTAENIANYIVTTCLKPKRSSSQICVTG